MFFLVVPRGDQVHVMCALVRALGVDARLARELDLHAFEDGFVRHGVDLADQLGVKVEVARQRRDRDEGRIAARARESGECRATRQQAQKQYAHTDPMLSSGATVS